MQRASKHRQGFKRDKKVARAENQHQLGTERQGLKEPSI